MSSFGRISKGLLREKVKFINLIFIINIFVVIYSLITNKFSNNTNSYTGIAVMSITLGVIFLCWLNEGVYSNDRYRLIPVSDGTMYFSNVLMSIIALVYLLVGEFIFYLIEYKLVPNAYDNMMMADFNGGQQYLFGLEILVTFILGVIFIFTVVTAIHMLTSWISNFLPFRNQTLIQGILAFVVIGVLMIPFNYITNNILKIFGIDNMNSSFAAVSHVMSAIMAMILIWIIVFTIINLYFLKRWSETTK